MARGVTLGGVVLCKIDGGTSKNFRKSTAASTKETAEADKALNATGGSGRQSNKSPFVLMKEPIATHFGFAVVPPGEIEKEMTRTRKVNFNGVAGTVKSLQSMGSTGKGRAMKVKFTKLQNIGKKQVASVNVPMPSSFTTRDMVIKLLASKAAGEIAQIVSPLGKTITLKTPYRARGRSGSSR